MLALSVAKIVNLPQVCIPFAKDAQGQILDEKLMEGKGLTIVKP